MALPTHRHRYEEVHETIRGLLMIEAPLMAWGMNVGSRGVRA